MGAIPSVRHQMFKFPTKQGIGIVRGDQPTSRNMYYTQVKKFIFLALFPLINEIYVFLLNCVHRRKYSMTQELNRARATYVQLKSTVIINQRDGREPYGQ